jgi:hypothetical protein
VITPLFQWRYNGPSAGNGWNSPVNGAEWGTDYLNRTGSAKTNMYDNRPEETKYIYTDDDSQGQQLNGQNTYAVKWPVAPPARTSSDPGRSTVPTRSLRLWRGA